MCPVRKETSAKFLYVGALPKSWNENLYVASPSIPPPFLITCTVLSKKKYL